MEHFVLVSSTMSNNHLSQIILEDMLVNSENAGDHLIVCLHLCDGIEGWRKQNKRGMLVTYLDKDNLERTIEHTLSKARWHSLDDVPTNGTFAFSKSSCIFQRDCEHMDVRPTHSSQVSV